MTIALAGIHAGGGRIIHSSSSGRAHDTRVTYWQGRFTAAHDARRISRRITMNSLRHVLAVGAALFVAGSTADAQLRRTTTTSYPDARTLPTGMCQVWIDGLPANRQPAATDCATARRTQPRNSRVIYGTRQPTNVYGNRDPRSIPGSPQYDPRFDPRSSQYDPRLDPHNRGNSEWERKQEREREKLARKQEKEREKEWRKSHKGHGKHDRDDDHDDGRYGRRGGTNGTYGTVQQGCVDVNRDGICDSVQSSGRVISGIPQATPQPAPQGTMRGPCTDANRDGRCDDGGPLIRRTP
jgi:hypothetical protein